VTRKFIEQGYYIAVANSVAMVGSATKDNILMKALSSGRGIEDVLITNTSEVVSQSMLTFRNA
jgi:hypothetical protein